MGKMYSKGDRSRSKYQRKVPAQPSPPGQYLKPSEKYPSTVNVPGALGGQPVTGSRHFFLPKSPLSLVS